MYALEKNVSEFIFDNYSKYFALSNIFFIALQCRWCHKIWALISAQFTHHQMQINNSKRHRYAVDRRQSIYLIPDDNSSSTWYVATKIISH